MTKFQDHCHPGVELSGNLKSLSCHLFEVAFVWELTKETIHLPKGRLQGREHFEGFDPTGYVPNLHHIRSSSKLRDC